MTALDDATGPYPTLATIAIHALLSTIADVAQQVRDDGHTTMEGLARIVAAAGMVKHGQ